MTNADIADTLDRAADGLIIYGRTTGAMCREDGSMCVQGAIVQAEGKQPWEGALMDHFDDPVLVAYEAWLAEAGYRPPNSTRSICAAFIFNDAVAGPGPDGDDLVIDTLRRCAKSLRG